MLESHTRQTDTIDKTAIKRARKKMKKIKKNNYEEKKQKCRAALGRLAMKSLGVFNSFVVDQPSKLVLLCFLRNIVVWKL